MANGYQLLAQNDEAHSLAGGRGEWASGRDNKIRLCSGRLLRREQFSIQFGKRCVLLISSSKSSYDRSASSTIGFAVLTANLISFR